jgi:hypothetical protein
MPLIKASTGGRGRVGLGLIVVVGSAVVGVGETDFVGESVGVWLAKVSIGDTVS